MVSSSSTSCSNPTPLSSAFTYIISPPGSAIVLPSGSLRPAVLLCAHPLIRIHFSSSTWLITGPAASVTMFLFGSVTVCAHPFICIHLYISCRLTVPSHRHHRPCHCVCPSIHPYPPLYFLSSNSTIVSPSFYLQYLYFCFILCVSFTPLFLCASIGNSGSNSALKGLFLYICMC
jgi:hypothetical protein